MKIREFAEKNSRRFEEELFQLLKIPSVSAQQERKEDCRKAGAFVLQKLKDMGLEAKFIETKGHPIAWGEKNNPKNTKTLLFYGHYDVQPEDPINEWETPPFDPQVRNGNVYARGASDDKGQMYAILKGLECFLAQNPDPKVNIKVLIEGEEEFTTENLEKFIQENKATLQADYVVICDTAQIGPDQPAITYALRGVCSYELKFSGPNSDLHSGLFGGLIQNPVTALTRFCAKLHDDNFQIQIPGFYDEVLDIAPWEKAMWKELPDLDESIKKDLGVTEVFGEFGYTSYERNWARPTCEINGFKGGYINEGFKTVIAKEAFVKISFRLVPGQDPKKIDANFKKFIEVNLPPGITYELKNFGLSPATLLNSESPGMEAAKTAIKKVFNKTPFMVRCGASIPVTAMFKNFLGLDSLMIGLGQPDDNYHAPNEKFSLKDFHRGVLTIAYLVEDFERRVP